MAAISEVSQIITRMNDLSTVVASALEQQTAVTREISRNVNDVAAGSEGVAGAIAEVATISQNTSDRAGRVQQASEGLAFIAKQLQRLVEQFNIPRQC